MSLPDLEAKFKDLKSRWESEESEVIKEEIAVQVKRLSRKISKKRWYINKTEKKLTEPKKQNLKRMKRRENETTLTKEKSLEIRDAMNEEQRFLEIVQNSKF